MKKKSDIDDYDDWFDAFEYQVGDLPSVRCAVATFPFTGGFISALMHNYKVSEQSSCCVVIFVEYTSSSYCFTNFINARISSILLIRRSSLNSMHTQNKT